jgi:hypothetical protein
MLWTGGWDSTFRYLDLAISKRRPVAPFYVIHADRLSTAYEIRAMKNIKERVTAEFPHTRSLLQPTQFRQMHEIPTDDEITGSFKRILAWQNLGAQYDWLARFARGAGLVHLEMTIHRDDLAHKVLEPLVIQYASEDGDPFYAVDGNRHGSDEWHLFKYFRFPLFELSKLEMQDRAREAGFLHLLDMSWFCHDPRPNGKPCGICKPCEYTREEGLGRRIPFSSRMRYDVRKALANFPPAYRAGQTLKKVFKLKWV